MATIASLVVSLTADAGGFTAGMEKAARSHDLYLNSIKSARSIIAATRTDSERYNDQLETLSKHFDKGRINYQQFSAALEMLNKGYQATTTAGKAAAAAALKQQQDLAAATKHAEGIYAATRSSAERYAQTVKVLDDHFAAGRINLDTYMRAEAQAKAQTDEGRASAEAAARAQQRLDDQVKAARGIYQNTRTAGEEYSHTVKELAEHLQHGRIDLDTYRRALAQAHEEMEKSQKGGGEGGEGGGFGFKGALEVSGILAGAEALKMLGEKAVETGRELAEFVHGAMEGAEQSQRMAEKLGVSIEQMTGLEYAAKITHTPIDALTTGMERMLSTLNDVSSDEGKKAAEALADLGLDAQKLANESPAKALEEIAESISHVGNSAQHMGDIRALFGRGGAEMIPLLMKGAEGMRQMQEEGKKMGFVLDSIDASKIHAANVAVDRLEALVQAVGKRLAVELSPYIEAAASKMFELAGAGGSMGQKVFTAVELAAKAIGYIADLVQLDIIWLERMEAAFSHTFGNALEHVAKLIDGLNRLPSRIKINTNALHDMADGMIATGDKLQETADRASKSEWAHQKVDEFFHSIRDGAQKAAEAAAANEKENEALGIRIKQNVEGMKEYAQATKDVAAFVDKLNAEIAAGGKSGPEAELQALSAKLNNSMLDAMKSQGPLEWVNTINSAGEAIDSAREKLTQLQNMQEAQAKSAYFQDLADKAKEAEAAIRGVSAAQKAVDEFKKKFKDARPDEISKVAANANDIEHSNQLKKYADEAKRLADEGRSPMEKHAEQLEHLQQALSAGAITQDEYTRAWKRSNDELEKSARLHQGMIDKVVDVANMNLAALAPKDFSFGAGGYVPPAGSPAADAMSKTPSGAAAVGAAKSAGASFNHEAILARIDSNLAEIRRSIQ